VCDLCHSRVCACACVAFASSSECRSVPCVWPWLPERVVVVHLPCVLVLSGMLPCIYSQCNAAVSTCENLMTALRGLSSCTRLNLFQSRAKASSDRATPSYRRFDTHWPSRLRPLDRAVRAAASRLVAVVQSWAAQADPACNSGLSAQVGLRKPSPIASGSDALRSKAVKAVGARWGRPPHSALR
jgi:hypothetical protein